MNRPVEMIGVAKPLSVRIIRDSNTPTPIIREISKKQN
jgi:hypothetical protein